MIKDLNQCSKECFECIKGYKTKHTLRTGQKFRVKCKGIPKDHIPISIMETINPEEREMAKGLLDPVTWAANTLDWHCFDPDGSIWKRKNPVEYFDWIDNNPGKDILGHSRYHRPYQAEMLRCSSQNKVFRIGRQCLTGDTLIQIDSGLLKSIKDIVPGDLVVSIDNRNQLVPAKVKDQWNSGRKPVYEIRTKFGHTIKCSDNHPFLVIQERLDKSNGYTLDKLPKEWMSIKDGLSTGNKIAVASKIESSIHNWDQCIGIGEWGKFLGYFIADGSSSRKQSAKFTNTNMDYLLEFESICKSFGTDTRWYEKGNGYDLIITNGRSSCNPVRDKLKEFGLINVTGPEKLIPECVFTAPRNEVKDFLNRFWSADGYISTFQRTGRKTFRTEVGTLQENRKLLEQLQHLLIRFGVHGYIKPEGNCYRLVISNRYSIDNFLSEIGPIFGKEEACSKAQQNLLETGDRNTNLTGEILWDYVSSIEYLGEEDTWDIEVEETHNFVANGIITHNCGKTECLVVSMLFNMFTKPGVPDKEGFKIVVLTPYQSQIELIFTRLHELINGSLLAQNSLKRYVKAPMYTIELHNRSIVRGFTAGTKSGGNAESVRGQAANMLVFDEADYLCTGDMDAAMSIVTNYPNATVWMSSTPSGKREKFYDNCYSRRYKEFHFPSYCNPLWNEDLEARFREELSEMAYEHECLAEFGEKEQGVFQQAYIQAAKADYKYEDVTPDNTWTYAFGVDWNDVKNGTTICVLGFNPSRSLFYVVHKEIVSKEGWTQIAACNKIAELNRIWRPMAIYADKGFGGTQIEVLKLEGGRALIDPTRGPNHPDSRLARIVKAYDFGSSVEVRDFLTKQPIKKNAKGFMVESCVRRFEANDIRFSEYDQVLEAQLGNYIIDRITPTGNPVYKPESDSIGDHCLDALMLSVLAFVLEVTPLGKPKFSSQIEFTGKLGEATDMEIHQGDLVVRSDRKKSIKEQRDQTRPQSRSIEQEQTIFENPSQLPANHTYHNEPKLWSHEGFNRDEPAPQARSLGSATRQNANRLGLTPRRGSRPTRRNI